MENVNSISERSREILAYLSKNSYGQEKAVRLALLSAVARKGIIFNGDDKRKLRETCRLLARAFKDFYSDEGFSINTDYFDYSIDSTTSVDSLCGYLDNSSGIRNTNGFLPSAKIAFLDIVEKPNNEVLNALLSILNDKIFYNGKVKEKLSWILMVVIDDCHIIKESLRSRGNSISNELGDNFIFNVKIDKCSSELFLKSISEDISKTVISEQQKSALFSVGEIMEWQDEIHKIKLSDGVKKLIEFYRKSCSDSKLLNYVHVIQTCAFLNGRNTAFLPDVLDESLEFKFFHKTGYSEYLEDKNVYANEAYRGGFYKKPYFNVTDELTELLKDFHDFVKNNGNENLKESSAKKLLEKNLQERVESICKIIESRVSQLKSYSSETITENIFSEKDNMEKIKTEIYEEIDDFESTKNAVRNESKKVKFSLVNDINVGDYILMNGTYIAQNDERIVIDKAPDHEIDLKYKVGKICTSNVASIVCIKGDNSNSLYGISQDVKKNLTFSEAVKFVDTYNERNDSVYSCGWMLPTVEQMQQIYQNKELLKGLSYSLSGEFWSAEEYDDSSVYLFNFDSGNHDYMPKYHKHSIFFVRKLGI